MALFALPLPIKNIVQPPIIGGFILDYAQKKRVIRIPKDTFGDFKN
jgi:hypothetical protein